jgi:putative amide transporter protein
MGSVGLLYVGAVLFINGASLLGWVKGKSLAPMNVFVGILQFITPLYLIFTANGDTAQILGAAGLFLFSFTYLYVALNSFLDLDGTGLGWFCLYVVAAAVVFAYFGFRDANAPGYLTGVLWVNWAFLWGLFWLVLALGRGSLRRYTGAVCATQGIITGLVPALILIGQPSWVTNELAIGIAATAVVLDLLYVFTVKKQREEKTSGQVDTSSRAETLTRAHEERAA